MYLFVRASGTGPNALADLLEDPGYREAQGVLEMISKSPSDLELYESRLKFLLESRVIELQRKWKSNDNSGMIYQLSFDHFRRTFRIRAFLIDRPRSVRQLESSCVHNKNVVGAMVASSTGGVGMLASGCNGFG
ncbi:MAG: hypothetical protein KDB03_06045 [Planctomycetales bacterium]|nr:hypothetical protein [Planctomycetales bacterium]